MNPQRPWGFRDFVRMRGYSSLYLFSVSSTRPIQVGITDDPLRRLGDFQVAHYHTVDFLRVWWLPGKPIASRIESAFKYHFIEEHIRGEWFDVTAEDAIAFVHHTIQRFSTPALVRAIRRRPDDVTGFGDARIWSETTRLDLRLAEVENLRPGDRIEIDGEAFLIQGEPVRDRERLVWTVELRPA